MSLPGMVLYEAMVVRARGLPAANGLSALRPRRGRNVGSRVGFSRFAHTDTAHTITPVCAGCQCVCCRMRPARYEPGFVRGPEKPVWHKSDLSQPSVTPFGSVVMPEGKVAFNGFSGPSKSCTEPSWRRARFTSASSPDLARDARYCERRKACVCLCSSCHQSRFCARTTAANRRHSRTNRRDAR